MMGRSKNTGGGCENERNEKLHEQIKMQKLFQAFAVVCTVAVAKERLRAEGEPTRISMVIMLTFKAMPRAATLQNRKVTENGW